MSDNPSTTALEAAWREGYAEGYANGTQDATDYERGHGHGLDRTKRDREEAWLASDTKKLCQPN